MGNRYTSAAYRELGAMLRRVRTEAGLSSTELAHRMGWSLTTVSRMETGHRPSTTTDVIQYAVMCGAKMPDLPPLLEFTRIAERKQGYYLSDEGIDGPLQSLIFHESSAERVIGYEPQVIPGLLQTSNYAKALVAALEPGHVEDWEMGVVRTRMERRRILSLPEPAQFIFYIHEHALNFTVGTDETMHEQLLHLVLTAGLKNISVRIVPSAARERSAFGGGFQVMEFREHRPIVSVDLLRSGGLIVEDPAFVNGYRRLLPLLAGVAFDEGQSRGIVASLADEFDRGSQRSDEDVLAEEQSQWRVGNQLCGGGVADPTTPIYE